VKIDRLISITNYLLHYGKTSAQKLSEEFEVSTRTIMRDIDTLGQAGIPIQSEYGADGGYKIIDTYVVDKKIINSQDYDYIIVALKGLLSAHSNKNIEQTIDKMIPFYDNKNNIINLDFGIANEKDEINQNILLLEDAIKRKRVVEFTYTNNENLMKQVQVEPVRIEFKWYNWYLIAFYPKHQDYCMFKLVRMEGLVILEKISTKEHEVSKITLNDNRNIITSILHGNVSIKSKCKEYLNGTVSKEYMNGDFDFCFSVPEDENYWFGVVLSFGNNVRVLEPQSVIDRIIKNCSEVSKIYEHDN
jgi:predicted DNA-binding transcriptional regulator YafY